MFSVDFLKRQATHRRWKLLQNFEMSAMAKVTCSFADGLSNSWFKLASNPFLWTYCSKHYPTESHNFIWSNGPHFFCTAEIICLNVIPPGKTTNTHCVKSVQIRTRKNSVFGHISHSEKTAKVSPGSSLWYKSYLYLQLNKMSI